MTTKEKYAVVMYVTKELMNANLCKDNVYETQDQILIPITDTTYIGFNNNEYIILCTTARDIPVDIFTAIQSQEELPHDVMSYIHHLLRAKHDTTFVRKIYNDLIRAEAEYEMRIYDNSKRIKNNNYIVLRDMMTVGKTVLHNTVSEVIKEENLSDTKLSESEPNMSNTMNTLKGYFRSSDPSIGSCEYDSEFYVAIYTKKVNDCDMFYGEFTMNDPNPKSVRSANTFLGPGLSAVLNKDEALSFFSIETMKAYIELMKKHVRERNLINKDEEMK